MGNAPQGDDMALNLAGLEFEDIRHWASVNGHEFPDLIQARRDKGWRMDIQIHSRGRVRDAEFPIHVWISPIAGSSSLFGAIVGLALGYEPVILCGCPLRGTNVFRKRGGGYESYLEAWERIAPELKNRVFSMSGLTQDLLGSPRCG